MISAPAPVPSSASDTARKLKWYAITDEIRRVKITWNASVHAVTRPSASSTRGAGGFSPPSMARTVARDLLVVTSQPIG